VIYTAETVHELFAASAVEAAVTNRELEDYLHTLALEAHRNSDHAKGRILATAGNRINKLRQAKHLFDGYAVMTSTQGDS